MIRGLNKPSVKKVRKNILPPFDNEGWGKYKPDVQDYVFNGYEVSYKTNETYGGLTYNVPLTYAGKVVSLSVQEMEGKTPRVMLSWRIGANVWNHNIYQIMGVPNGSINGIKIPANAEEIVVYAQETAVRGRYTRFKGIQLEENVVATAFEEQLIEGAKSLNELAPKKNIFDGLIEKGNISALGVNESGLNNRSVNYIPAKANQAYIMSRNASSGWNPRIFYFDSDLKLITSSLLGEATTPHKFTTPSRTSYIRWHDYATTANMKVQIEEGSMDTVFEDYELVKKPKSERLVPHKNLIPSTERFIDSAKNAYDMPMYTYFLVGYNPSETDYVTVKGDYELEITASANNRDVRVIIPAKPNTTYRTSCDTNGDIHLFYLDGNKNVITQTYNTISANTSGTTPSNCAYIMFALTNRGLGAGKFYFKNWQLEESEMSTSFEPRREVNKKAHRVPKRNMLNPDAWVSGRVFDTAFKAQNGYRINGDNLIIMSGINGMVSQVVDVKPNTLYTVFHDSDNDGSRGVYIYSLTGTDLTPSAKISPNVFNSGNNNKIIVGMYKSTSANNLSEIEIVKPMMIEGSIKADFEPFSFANESDNLVPKKNILPPLRYWSRTDGNANILSDYEGEINPVSNYTGFKYASSLGLKRDTMYTISVDEITPSAVFFIAYVDSSGDNKYITANSTSLSRSFSIPSSAKSYWIEMHFQTNRGKAKFKNFMIYEGNLGQKFEPMELVKKNISRLAKAPHKRYPFNYQRESIEYLDNVRYGHNAPRIKGDGLLIEEDTTNLVPKIYDRYPAVMHSDITSIDGNHHTMRLPNDSDRDHMNVPIMSVRPSASYTLSYKARVLDGEDIYTVPYIAYGGTTTLLDGTKPILIGKDWVHVSRTVTMGSSTTESNRYCPYFRNCKGQLIEIKEWQFEEKPLETSYTYPDIKRPLDRVTTPVGVIDNVGGSVEFTYVSTADWKAQKANSQARYFCATDTSDTQIFRLWSWGGSENHLGTDFKSIDNGRQYTDKGVDLSTKFLVGKPVKLRVEWGSGFLRTYIDDELFSEATGLRPFKNTSASSLIIGGTVATNSDKCFIGIYKNFVIKNRNGLKTFSF